MVDIYAVEALKIVEPAHFPTKMVTNLVQVNQDWVEMLELPGHSGQVGRSVFRIVLQPVMGIWEKVADAIVLEHALFFEMDNMSPQSLFENVKVMLRRLRNATLRLEPLLNAPVSFFWNLTLIQNKLW